MKNFSIKVKLIVLFILIKVLPLLLLAYIAIQGVKHLEQYFIKNTTEVFDTNKKIIENTAQKAINDSIIMLDKKSQLSIEKLSYQIAQQVAAFLYERDNDLLFLASMDVNDQTLQQFYAHKNKNITLHEPYTYNTTTHQWESNVRHHKEVEDTKSSLVENNNEFHYTNPKSFQTQTIPLYKEITLFNLQGQEQYKVSSINSKKLNIAQKEHTYLKAEDYFHKIQQLKQGEIYVSEVIGEYVPSKIIGLFTHEKAQKINIPFKPSQHGYAGVENPVGKPFKGIIRFITPYYKNNQHLGYLSLALDHRHIMEFTDTFNPTNENIKQNIANASLGNYAFMWDFEGKNISHPRDYFIFGYDKTTGQPTNSWISQDMKEAYEASSYKNIKEFLDHYPLFNEQSLTKKPNLEQLRQTGEVALDCRYLNFAPQCKGWMEVTKDGGYGSFIIFWSNVWKLTTAASIPYYTGQYQNSKRGFGFVTIGANVNEFHKAAMQTQENVNAILKQQNKILENTLQKSNNSITDYIQDIIEELTIFTTIMVILVMVIAIWLSNYIISRIKQLLIATKKFSNKEYDYKIKVTSNDEIGQLEHSFNDMTSKVTDLIQKQKESNSNLEKRIDKAIEQTEINERTIREKDNILAQQSKMAAMGEMLENIAHQWRQPLSSISTASSGLKIKSKMQMLEENEVETTLDEITHQTQYLSNTIDDFRNYFKTDKSIDTFYVNETIDKTLKIIGSKFENLEISIVKKLQEVEIISYENELIQVLINLLNNSKDEFLEREIAEKLILIDLYKEGDFVFIETKDTALGIQKALLNRIFEPYFTTKHKTQGTGIGLHMSREIITKHMNGDIAVENCTFNYNNQTFTGAKFTIKLPLKVSLDTELFK